MLKIHCHSKKNSFDVIIASHILEHITNEKVDGKKRIYLVFEEIHRLLKNKGVLKIWVPHDSGWLNRANIDHERSFNSFSFDVFRPNHPENCYTTSRFKIKNIKLNFTKGKGGILNKILNPILNKNHLFTEKFLCGFLRIDELYVELEAIK